MLKISKMEREEDYFGEKLGFMPLQQLTIGEFHHECAKKETESADGDNTGLRLYAGAHVAIRLVASLSDLLDQKSIIELGCGVGALSLIGTQLSDYSKLVLTDGEQRTLDGAQVNAGLICTHCGLSDRLNRIFYSLLPWGDEPAAYAVREKLNDNRPFDIVLGCELMYYRTEVATIVRSVMTLTAERGLFIHCHLFRRSGQEQDLIDLLSAQDWMSWEVPHESFISGEELRHHPEWFKMRALVSGPRDRLLQWRASGCVSAAAANAASDGAICSDNRCSRWVEFRPEPIDEQQQQQQHCDDGDEDPDEHLGLSMFR